MRGTLGWQNGQWQRFEQLQLPLDDLGILQGAVLVERLRSVGGIVLAIADHYQRLAKGCDYLGLKLPAESTLSKVIQECVDQNQSFFQITDCNVVVLVTPGQSRDLSKPNLIVHAAPINWPALKHWYSSGQELLIANTQSVASGCWPSYLKTRSRLNYFIADQQASAAGNFVAAVLTDSHGNLTETSAANLIYVDRPKRLIVSPLDTILPGISLHRTLDLATDLGFEVTFRHVQPSELLANWEVLLTGTNGFLWRAAKLGDVYFKARADGSVYTVLRDAWIADIGFDFVQQAHQLSG